VKSARAFNDNYKQVKAICQNVTMLLKMREQALAPIAMFSADDGRYVKHQCASAHDDLHRDRFGDGVCSAGFRDRG
jgi:hypothetical protein